MHAKSEHDYAGTVLLTTPSLDLLENVSGVASVVRLILQDSDIPGFRSRWRLKTVTIGKSDKQRRGIIWALSQVLVPIKFAYFVVKLGPQIVHINGPLGRFAIFRDAVLMIVAKLLRRQIVHHLHGGPFVSSSHGSFFLRKVVKAMLRLPSVVVVLSSREAQSIQQNYDVPPERLRILPNAVRLPPEQTAKDAKGPLRVLSIGRLSPEKGLITLCEAVEQHKKLSKSIEMQMFGAGELQDEVTKRLGATLGSKFLFGGVADEAKRKSAYEWADVVVLPSLWGEGLPMVILEAMSYGVVPIATDDGAISDVVSNGISGFLVSKGAPEELAETLMRVSALKHEGALKKMSRAARAIIEENHSIDRYYQALDAIYGELVVPGRSKVSQ